MSADDILTPQAQLQETALKIVMKNAPDLNILASVALTKAIAKKLSDAEFRAGLKSAQAVVDGARK